MVSNNPSDSQASTLHAAAAGKADPGAVMDPGGTIDVATGTVIPNDPVGKDKPPGATVSTTASGMYGTVIRSLRSFTAKTVDKEPKWRVKGSELRTGYQKTW